MLDLRRMLSRDFHRPKDSNTARRGAACRALLQMRNYRGWWHVARAWQPARARHAAPLRPGVLDTRDKSAAAARLLLAALMLLPLLAGTGKARAADEINFPQTGFTLADE